MSNIYTSHTRMPPLVKYTKYLKKLWKTRYLTNNGPFVQKLEERLKKYWNVKHVVCVSNGTSATEIAIKAMDIHGTIHLYPFSYVSTASVPLWLGNKIKFVDLDSEIKGPAIVTHVYGIPNLMDVHPVIYDASHAFAVNTDGHSILSEGDCSIISFHATKMFQSVEGGAIVTNNDEIAEKARWMRNFGHNGQYEYYGAGINAKMSEFHAIMGLCSLDTIKDTKKRYDQIIKRYNKALDYNWSDVSYYPIFYESEEQCLKAIEVFEKYHIYPRRYFYPSLNTIFGKQKCLIAETMASMVLCLPLYYELTDKQVDKIIKIVKQTL